MFSTSPKGINLIKILEGLRLKWYLCTSNFKTIGYGHRWQPGDNFESLTKEQAHDLLIKDLKERENHLNGLNLKINQNEFDALISFIYNIGFGAFITSTVYKGLLNDDRELSRAFWMKWVGIPPEPGLVNRRAEELKLFDSSEV